MLKVMRLLRMKFQINTTSVAIILEAMSARSELPENKKFEMPYIRASLIPSPKIATTKNEAS